MAKSFNQLRNKMSPKAQKLALEKTKKMLAEMDLQELRQTRHLSQERLAEILLTKQANVSRIENRGDMYISTLRNYIEGMGGHLDIVARFPEGDIRIILFKKNH